MVLFVSILFFFLLAAGCTDSAAPANLASDSGTRSIVDNAGRIVTIPSEVNRSVCTAGGTCVRYLSYMDAADTLVAVESGEQLNETTGDNRAYVLANPQFANLSSTGSSRESAVNPEQLVALKPQVIFVTGAISNQTSDGLSSADTLQAKTGIPVIVLASGSFQDDESKAQMYSAYRLLGQVFGNEDRAEELIGYCNSTIADLNNRTQDIPESEQKTAFIGGLSHAGAHGLLSTQSDYMPFTWNHVKNIANGSGIQNSDFSKEGLIYADPDYIFIDAGTLGVQTEIGGFEEIKSPVYKNMKAVKAGNVYAPLPYTSRSTNLETQLVDAYFIGKTVYPEKFADIDPKTKADEIYTMFVGKPVFDQLNAKCNNLAFQPVLLNGS